MIYLLIAVALDVAGTVCMKFSSGFTNILPSILVFIFYGLCSTFLTLALRSIEIGTAYAVVAGGGIFMIVLIGVLCFREAATLPKILGTVFIIIGVITLHLAKA